MAEQLSLFGSPEKDVPSRARDRGGAASSAPAVEPSAAFASVVVDIPTRALSDPFVYGVPQSLLDEVEVGSTVLVDFGHRAAAGYVVDLAHELYLLPGTDGIALERVKPIGAVLTRPLFTGEAARIAVWMSREYVATLSECLRLFLPPGGSPRVVKD